MFCYKLKTTPMRIYFKLRVTREFWVHFDKRKPIISCKWIGPLMQCNKFRLHFLVICWSSWHVTLFRNLYLYAMPSGSINNITVRRISPLSFCREKALSSVFWGLFCNYLINFLIDADAWDKATDYVKLMQKLPCPYCAFRTAILNFVFRWKSFLY